MIAGDQTLAGAVSGETAHYCGAEGFTISGKKNRSLIKRKFFIFLKDNKKTFIILPYEIGELQSLFLLALQWWLEWRYKGEQQARLKEFS
ncbi:hypothetical protein SAMN05443252_10275 [Bacillus sp. OV322]|nr:hypothetical protein SAMN05443252_10275 [Bacillus sp. OV322]